MKLFKKFLIVLAIGFIPFVACDTDALVELNDNPHAVLELDWRYVLSEAQVSMAENRGVNWKPGLIISSMLIQHYAASGTNCGDKYARGALTIDHQTIFFHDVYDNGMKDAAEVIRRCGPNGVNPEMTNTYNAARILYVYMAQIMTDLYGNVPYFDANRGIEGSEYFLPRYDSQEDIYTREGIGEGEVRGGLLWELDDAAAGLASAGIDDLTAADLIFQGDLTKWRKWAYSMMLRAAMRINEADPATAATYVAKAIAGGVMTSNLDNAYINMATGPSEWFNQNGISRGMKPGSGGESHDWIRPSNTLINFLKGNNDPRLMILSGGVGSWQDCTADLPACSKVPADQIGRPNGYNNGDNDPNVDATAGIEWWCAQDPFCASQWDGVTPIDPNLFFSGANPLLFDLDEPYMFLNYAETELLLAEAVERGIANTGQAASAHYDAGVRAAINRWILHDASFAVLPADIDAYLLEPAIAYTPGLGGLEQIGWQYWLATFMSTNHFETFANWRRTGRPSMDLVTWWPGAQSQEPWRKYIYDNSDVAINDKNFKAGASLPNEETTRGWWDLGYNGVGGNQTQ
jgi:hypothetical protein